MNFEIIGKVTDVETIAVGSNIRILPVLQRRFGKGRWRKLKGIADVRLYDGTNSPGRSPLVRGARHRQKIYENQTLS